MYQLHCVRCLHKWTAKEVKLECPNCGVTGDQLVGFAFIGEPEPPVILNKEIKSNVEAAIEKAKK